jgi:hypothetical protein
MVWNENALAWQENQTLQETIRPNARGIAEARPSPTLGATAAVVDDPNLV